MMSMKTSALPFAKNILDIGAGEGRFIKQYPYVDTNITLLDQEESEFGCFEECKKNNTDKRFTYVTGMSNDMSMFEDDSFDMIHLSQVIEHIPVDQLDVSMREIRRVLKPGGLFCMSTPNRDVRKEVGNYLANEFHVQEFINSELLDLYNRHNFTILENIGITKIDVGKLLMNQLYCEPEKGYQIWITATKPEIKEDIE